MCLMPHTHWAQVAQDKQREVSSLTARVAIRLVQLLLVMEPMVQPAALTITPCRRVRGVQSSVSAESASSGPGGAIFATLEP